VRPGPGLPRDARAGLSELADTVTSRPLEDLVRDEQPTIVPLSRHPENEDKDLIG
jgi:hypothetical protein